MANCKKCGAIVENYRKECPSCGSSMKDAHEDSWDIYADNGVKRAEPTYTNDEVAPSWKKSKSNQKKTSNDSWENSTQQNPNYNKSSKNKSYNAQPITVGEKMMSMCAYIWWLFIIPLIFGRQSAFARAHFNQGFILFLLSILVAALDFTGMGLFILFFVNIYCIIRATSGRMPNIPYICEIRILK